MLPQIPEGSSELGLKCVNLSMSAQGSCNREDPNACADVDQYSSGATYFLPNIRSDCYWLDYYPTQACSIRHWVISLGTRNDSS